MHRKIKHLILLSALVAVTSLAMAQDPPARVARVSVVEGQVTVQEADGDEAGGNLVNWPVTSGTRITAAPGSRTEFRVGSTAVRLDGDSSMEVLDLDDNVLRLRLDYGTASVRVRNPEHVGGFELSTPQARVTLTEPGALRVDTERAPDTSVVTMLAGTGRVDGAGTSMSLRAGKRLEVRGDDLFTGVAQRTQFDDWVQARDRRDDNSQSLRYVTADMTGYEELDQHGSWREDPDYGPLWAPRGVASDWAPYRDGRWTWLEPWGWTWVDDAPWGYAPSHYGRWVFVQSRWFWAPGRTVVRPVWAPALVGWVGGSGWNVTFRDHRAGPGVGWYPLTPRDRYVPHYRVSVEHERRLEWQHNGKVRWKEDPRRDGRRDGVTVLPREYFERRSIVNVGREPRVALPPGDVRKAPLISAPPMAPQLVNRPGRVIDARRDGRDDWRERHGDGQRQVIGQPVPGNALQGQPQRVMPGGAVVQQPGAGQDERRRFDRPGRDDGERRNDRDERGRISQPQPQALQPGQLPQQHVEQQRQERQRLETLRQDQQRQEGQRQERQRQDAQQEQQRQEALRQDQQRQEYQRQERQRQDGQRHEAQRQEQQRQQEAQRQDAQRQEQQRQQEAQRQDAQRQEQHRQERQRQESQQREQQQRQDQQRQDALRQDMQRQEQQRQQEAQRQDAQRQEQQRQQREAMRQQQAQQQRQEPRQEARPQPQPAPAAEQRRPQREEKDNKDNGRRKNLE